jgi:UDP-N-acetylmuramoyl-tripeptide--D-alanyl-D-alanine ligase
MIPISLAQLANVTQGHLVGDDKVISAVSTDTRNIEPGALFVAINGVRFDAHEFVEQAMSNGASALLVEKSLDIDAPQVVVADTTKALGDLGAWVLEQSDVETIAITGSCGKTTVKEMLASILQLKGKTLATKGNFNNEFGVPLTLLRLDKSVDYAVIELGANHVGEIAYTSGLVKPAAAMVNNVAAAHLEGFGSIDGVKQAKGEIYQGLVTGGFALVNMDSQGGQQWQDALSDKRVQQFSQQNSLAEYYASHIEMDDQGYSHFHLHTPYGTLPVSLNVIGEHNVSNAVAAAALALNVGVDLVQVKQGLEQLSKVKGRVAVESLTDTIRLIDDSYNASVPAVKAAIDLLARYHGQRWLILGFMAELGDESLALHRQVGEHASNFGFEHVLTFGDDTKVVSELTGGHHFSDHQALIAHIKAHLIPAETNTLLIKGALSSQMGTVVSALKEMYP